jgi:hypothetical protein
MTSTINTAIETANQSFSAYSIVERLTGVEIPEWKPGRAIWGAPGIGCKGSLHVEILMSDKMANDLAIEDLHRDGFPHNLSSKERYRLYCKLCREHARKMNDEEIEAGGMILLIKRNGNPTRMLTILHKAIGRSMSKFPCNLI